MKRIPALLAGSALLCLLAAHAAPARNTIPFDSGWRFLKADAPGAQAAAFDDASWRPVDLPHDWSIEGSFDQNNPTRGSGAWLPSGVGWYRKRFVLAEADSARRVFLEFDGVMANSEVWVNGFSLGKRPYGYVSFRYELTGHVGFGAGHANVVAVRADTSAQPASRWYSGAGIYRHVRLIVAGAVHLDQWATFVTTPKISEGQATVRVETNAVNQSAAPREVVVEASVYAPSGKEVGKGTATLQTVPAGGSTAFTLEIPVRSPALWDLDRPQLYAAMVRLRSGGATLDDEAVPFGIRDAHFDAATGFWLNGRNIKLKGVCLHHDGGAMGAAVPLGVWELRLKALRSLGVNAIRTAHNPVAPEFLELCDRMGFLVMDELFDCWTVAKNPYDYHLYFREWSKIDARDTVRRDRNHPSVILYSAGNEIHDTPNAELAKGILAGLIEVFHANDPTRPVTQALLRPNQSHDYDDGLADMLDVVGQNYRETEILAAHAAKPTRKILGTENHGEAITWRLLRDNPPYAGQFLWSGIDYLGESRSWPANTAGSGLLDRTGAIKPSGYERQSWWSEKPMVYMVRRVAPPPAPVTDPGYEAVARRTARTTYTDWTPAGQSPHEETVEVYSNCEEVELFLNLQSLGAKALTADPSPRVWKVQYAPGLLSAQGRNKGVVVAMHLLRTAAAPARIVLTADRSSTGPDAVVFVRATVVDKDGVRVPGSGTRIAFETSGPGTIVAVDNADNSSQEPFQATGRNTFDGQCLAILRPASGKGTITVKARAEGLETGSTQIEVGGNQ